MSGHQCVLSNDGKGTISVAFKHPNSEMFYQIKDDLKRLSARFDGESKTWRLPEYQWHSIAQWVRRWFPGHLVINNTGLSLAQTGGAPPPPPPPPPRQVTTVDVAYRALYLLPGAPRWAVLAQFRAATKANHPDAGGSHEAMVRINTAFDTLKKAGVA